MLYIVAIHFYDKGLLMNSKSIANSLLATTTCLMIAFGNAEARRINVPEDQETIQLAINASENGDEVLVAPGVYLETINFGGKAIVIASLILTTGDRAYIDSTVIDADGNGPVVVFNNRETEGSVLCGFTITNGIQGWGGGIDCQGEIRPQLLDLHVTGNLANNAGGGIYCTRGAAPLIERCLIDNNRANAQGGGGIGIFMDAFPVIRNCKILNNSAPNASDGGGIWISGGGVSVTDSEISGNDAFLGGGLYATLAVSVDIRNSTIRGNSSEDEDGATGGITIRGRNAGDGRADVVLDHVAITENVSVRYCALQLSNCNATLANLTIANNLNDADLLGRFENCEMTFVNSIIFGNEGIIEFENPGRQMVVDYCDVEGGNGLFVGEQGFIWGENNLHEDPMFVDSEQHDYRLDVGSPCIDAGDPDSTPDPDGTRSDMGAYYFDVPGAWVYGTVAELAGEEPIENARVSDSIIFRASTDSLGRWSYPVVLHGDSARIRLRFEANGFIPQMFDSMVHRGDSIALEVLLGFGELTLNLDSIVTDVDSGSFREVPLILHNEGNGTLTWSAKVRNKGVLGLPLGGLRESLRVSDVTDDLRIEGAAFDGERFYLSGANDAADIEDNVVYVLNRDGALVDSFLQVGSSRYGYKDMDWDGESIWAVGEDSVYCLTTEGRVIRRWVNPSPNPTPYLTYDNVDQIVWIASTTSDYTAHDRLGNRMGRTLDNLELKTYGLGFSADDPDGYCLYVVNMPSGQEATCKVTKMNTETGDTMFVFELPDIENSTGFVSAYICNNYDEFFRPVLMTMQNIPANSGGDRLEIFQLHGNMEWLTVDPDAGSVEPNEEAVVNLRFGAIAADSSWSFDLGLFEGEIVISHDGLSGEVILPVTMNVVEPNSIASLEPSLPVSIALLSAYPNPFNSTTKITYGLDKSALTRLVVYGIDGREVVDLLDRQGRLSYGVGMHAVVWNAEGLPGGIYFVRLEAGVEMKTMKVVLLK